MVLVFEPAAGAEPRMDEVLRAARQRAERAGWHCWAYRNEINASELMLFIEGPEAGPGAPAVPVFGDEIAELRALSRRFEPVRSLVEYSLDGEP
jgi:hypothetical protein